MHGFLQMPSKQGESCDSNITSFVIEYVTDESIPVRGSLVAPVHYTVIIAKLQAWKRYKFSVYARAGLSKSAKSNEKSTAILGIGRCDVIIVLVGSIPGLYYGMEKFIPRVASLTSKFRICWFS